MNRKDLRILVIEDELGNTFLMKRNLAKCGFDPQKTTFVDNHDTTVDLHPNPEKEFDIILSDIHTGGGNGIDYAKHMKADADARGVAPVPFILHSTDTRTADQYRANGLADGLISKDDLCKNPEATIRIIEQTLGLTFDAPAATINASASQHQGIAAEANRNSDLTR